MHHRYLMATAVSLFVLSSCSLAPESTPSAPISKITCQKLDGARVTLADADCENALPGANCGTNAQECKEQGQSCSCRNQFN
jgi:hypothetical protein